MTDTLARQRQLVGTTAQWAANDLIIGDGEIAVERLASGSVRFKVGNGTSVFSALPYTPAAGGAFGEGYSWRNVTGTRTDGTTYTAPDHPIMVSYILGCSANDGQCGVYAGPSTPSLQVGYGTNAGNGAMAFQVSAIIPPFYKYTFATANVNTRSWLELRAD